MKTLPTLCVVDIFTFFWPCCMACGTLGDPLTRDWTWATAVEVSSPNYWTGREFPCLLHFSHSDGSTVVLHYGHDLHFPCHYWSWAFFHIFHIFSYISWKSGYPFFFFCKDPVQVFCPFIYWDVCFFLSILLFHILITIHLEFIFLYGVSQGSSIILFYKDIQLTEHHFIFYCNAVFFIIQVLYVWRSVSGLSSVGLWNLSLNQYHTALIVLVLWQFFLPYSISSPVLFCFTISDLSF